MPRTLLILILASLLGLAQGVQAQQCNYIYVTPNGANSGQPGQVGTRTNPASLAFAISDLLSPSTQQIFMAVGVYTLDTTLNLVDGLTVEGGFLPNEAWAKTNRFATIIYRTATNPDTAPARVVGISGDGVQDFRIQDIRLFVEDVRPLANSTSAYGIRLNNCSNYVINRCFIRGSNAANGDRGVAGRDGRNGADGGAGGNGDCSTCRPGGDGGDTWSATVPAGQGAAGGDGGDGGDYNGSGFTCCVGIFGSNPCPDVGEDGEDGANNPCTATGIGNGEGGRRGQKN